MARQQITRRGLLAAGGAAVVGAAGGAVLMRTATEGSQPVAEEASRPAVANSVDRSRTYAFHGAHQAGVETPAQMYSTFLGLNLREKSAQKGEAVMRILTDDAERMMAGEPSLIDSDPDLALNPAGLTITVGVGRNFFTAIGREDMLPEQFPEIPTFSTDALDPYWDSTDLLVHVGSDDPVTLAHAVRVLTKDLSTLCSVEWVQQGFGAAGPANEGGTAGRNLMGQVDGTVNPQMGTVDFDQTVWLGDDGGWAAGGTVAVIRRIRMLMEDWDAMDRSAKELAIGRSLDTGAPLGGSAETDAVDLDARDSNGLPLIPGNAHVRVAHANTPEEMILRRPFNYDAGFVDGKQDLGLIFAAYTKDPRKSFIPMQERIASNDAFNRWNTTIGSSTYLILPGVEHGDYLASALFS